MSKKSEKKAAKQRAKAEKQARKEANKHKKLWTMMSKGATIGAGVVTKKALDATWRTATGHAPPNKAEHPRLGEREALTWAAISGMAIGVTRAAASRRAANYWVKSTGKAPPGLSGEIYKSDKKQTKSQS